MERCRALLGYALKAPRRDSARAQHQGNARVCALRYICKADNKSPDARRNLGRPTGSEVKFIRLDTLKLSDSARLWRTGGRIF